MAGVPVRINTPTVAHVVVEHGLVVGGVRNGALEAGGQGGVKLEPAAANDHFRGVVGVAVLLRDRIIVLVVVTETQSYVLQIPSGIKAGGVLIVSVGRGVGESGYLGGI